MSKISEKELYLYIFYPEDLSNDKKDHIDQNKSIYAGQLTLLREMKLSSEQELTNSILERIYTKIDAVQNNQIIILEKLKLKGMTNI